MKKIVFMDDVLDALIDKGQASKRYKPGDFWELNAKEIREALDTVPEIDLKITKVAPVQQEGKPGQLDKLAKLFRTFRELLELLPPGEKNQAVVLKFTDAMGTYLEIMEGTDDEGMGNEDGRA